MLFTGARRVSTVSLNLGVRERFAVLALIVLILGGGIFPQPGVESRYNAARLILEQRKISGGPSAGEATETEANPFPGDGARADHDEGGDGLSKPIF